MNSKIDVLNHGFVELVDVMGDDRRVVDAARVSVSGKEVKATSSDRGLIRYLMRHHHWTPFEMVRFTFNVKAPIFVVRQWQRHRASSYNEMSGRYSVLPDEFYIPDEDRVREQSRNNKQGSGEGIDPYLQEAFVDDCCVASGHAYEHYEKHLDQGIARETARINLPLNLYTQFYWSVDLRNLMNFLKLRMDSHAQYEIRVYGDAVYEMLKDIVPMSMEAFDDYILNSRSFSAKELAVLKEYLPSDLWNDMSDMKELAEKIGSKREAGEFVDKLL